MDVIAGPFPLYYGGSGPGHVVKRPILDLKLVMIGVCAAWECSGTHVFFKLIGGMGVIAGPFPLWQGDRDLGKSINGPCWNFSG